MQTGEKIIAGLTVIKHPKPKILLLDLQDSVTITLKTQGFNITEGSMGRPYNVPKSSSYQPLIGIAKASNLSEQEIVVIDLEITSYLSGPEGQKHRPNQETDLFGKCDRGYLDPRVRTAMMWRENFDRIHSNGGAFIIFADKNTGIDVELGSLDRHGNYYTQENFPHDVWDLLTDLPKIGVKSDGGREMTVSDTDSPLAALLAKYLPESEFSCIFDGWVVHSDTWKILATNKFGNAVALASCKADEGPIIVLPQIKDKPGFISELMTAILPELWPHLFPFIEKGKWTHHPEYELPLVMDLQARQAQIREKAEADIEALTAQIQEEREANGWMHDLLTATDTPLVEAVKKALQALGFEKVVDVDEIQDQAGKSRREDLQIHDEQPHNEQPVLIVDIKGLGGFPSDSDANQSFKHTTLRSKEWKRFDVQALTLINHQRHLPPLDRDNDMPFRQELLEIASEHQMGLMTTWDLYRLVRGNQRWGWKPNHTKPILYRIGRIDPVPSHYVPIGTVAHFYEKAGAVSIQIDAVGLSKGDRIAFELDTEYEEQDVTELQVEKANVEVAAAGTRAGTKTHLKRSSLKERTRVFLIPRDATG